MGRKVGLNREQVVEAAAAIADRDGLGSLSLATLASKLGVRSPSLYSHVDGLAGQAIVSGDHDNCFAHRYQGFYCRLRVFL